MTGVLLLSFAWLCMWLVDRLMPYEALPAAILSAVYMAMGVWRIADGDAAMAAVDAGISGWFAYLAWTRRKPRQRKPSKVAAKVRDLGHRLVAVPT